MVRNAPPTGTLTFLFTDIEGSTRSWESDASRMSDVLSRHNTLLAQTIERYGGVVFKTVGDEFCAAFATPDPALQAAIDAQRELTALVRVRMALHSGTALARDGDYFGPTLNRVARLMSIGHGGQILVSGVTAALLRDGVGQAQLRDLGLHRLRDLSEPERVFQAIADDLPVEFPPLESIENRANNLPAQLTTFIGREDDVRDLNDALQATRLLTLTGPGGIGKTRLALEVASQALDRFPHGVWFIDLSAIQEGQRIPESIAAALALQEQNDRSHWDVAISFLRDKQLLLIFDNCEHIVDECARRASEILQSAHAVQMLATSREPLSVPGERLWAVPSLLESHGVMQPPSDNAAVRLFIDRAMLSGRAIDLSGEAMETIGEICRCLDGIPLAVELAASRAQSLTVSEILSHLGDLFRFLSSGDRTRLPRQKTLRGAIDWSYQLLDEQERTIFARASVFTGEFDLKAAEQICADGDIAGFEVLDGLSALVSKSFVVRRERDGSSRYRLLETLRQYAAEKLAAKAEVEATRRRHFDYYLAYGVRLSSEFTVNQAQTLRAFDADYENLRSALAWGFEASVERTRLLQLAVALSPYWESKAHVNEGRLWFDKLLSDTQSDPADATLAAAFSRAGRMANIQGDYAGAIANGRLALRMRRRLDDEAGIADSLNNLGAALLDAGRARQATVVMEKALALFRLQGNVQGQARILCNLGLIAFNHGNHQLALNKLHEGLVLNGGTDDLRTRAFVFGALGTVSHHAGAIADSLEYNSRSLELLRSLGEVVGQTRVLNNLADVTLEINDLPAARGHIAECIRICEERGLRHEYADALDCLCIAEERSKRFDSAARLIGAADAIRSATRQPLGPYFASQRQKIVNSIERDLGVETFERLRLSGERADPKQLTRTALA